MKPAVSLQLYTVRDALQADLASTLDRVASIGLRSVELFDFVGKAAQYAKALRHCGLAAPSGHVHLIGQDLAPIFEAALEIGVGTLIDPSIDAKLWTSEDDVRTSAAGLNEIARDAAAHGLQIGYHNHWWELENRISGVPALEVFADQLDPEVVLEVDTYWAEVGGVPAAQLLERLGERVRFIHVKDGAVTRNDKDQVAVGSGAIPVLDILAAAPGATRVVELDDFDGDVFDAVADSVAFLRRNGEPG